MYKNKEIEFKTIITEEQYYQLIKDFELENNIFCQTNHYFDTDDTKLLEEKTVLRIRQKGHNYKLTKKTRADVGADEVHILISKDKAQELLENGFNAEIIGLPYNVKKIAELTTYRASTPYKDGILFFDKSVYYNSVDFEIEYEVNDVNQGQVDFNNFLRKYNITYKESIRKSKRAYDKKQ